MNVIVPCESGNFSIAEVFTVEPSIELTKPWLTKSYGETVDSITVDFCTNGDGLTKALQSVTFIVSIPSNITGWKFYGNGVEVISAAGNCQYNISSKKLSPTVMELTMSQVDSMATTFKTNPMVNLDSPIKVEMNPLGEKMEVAFRYVMQYSGGAPIENGLYMSQDPRVGSRR